jgi:hypothetical protein
LDNAITIKPLSHLAKSNLYIYTEARRFNVSLAAGPQASADYIVYLESEVRPSEVPIERWRGFKSATSSRSFKLATRRLGSVGDLLMLDFSISSKREMSFKPEWIWLTQDRKTVSIQSLSLSGVKLAANSPIQGLLTLKRSDAPSSSPLVLEIRLPAPIFLQLPEVRSWMK